MNNKPAIEFSPISIIEEAQALKLGEMIRYVLERSPFYKRHFKTSGISISKEFSLREMSNLPFTTKNDIQLHNWDFLCVRRPEIAEYTSTSGTLGKPVTIALTPGDINRLAYNEALSFACAGANESDLFQLMLTLDRQFMAGLAYHEGIRKLGAGVVRVGPGLPAMQWETIFRLEPSILVAVPSFVVKLLDYAKQNQINPNSCSVKRIVCIGEPIRTPHLELNTLGRTIAQNWNVKLISTYASTEMQTAFTECEFGCGGHLHPELLIVEVVDEDGKPLPPGKVGEVTITTLGVEAMPLIRYKTGDMAAIYTDACRCGRTTPRIGPIVGRKQQMLKLKGTTLYPPAIFDVLNELDGLQDFIVEAMTGPFDTDEIRIHALANEIDQANVRATLSSAFQSRLRVVPEIRFVSNTELSAMNGSAENRKIRKFVDTRKPNPN